MFNLGGYRYIGGMTELFLDSNAHLPMCQPALDAFILANKSLAGHGHSLSPSVPGRAAESAIEKARQDIAYILGAETSNNIFFTSTCTHACEWGIDIFRNINKDAPFIYSSPVEHPAVRQALSKGLATQTLSKEKVRPDLLSLDIDTNARVKVDTHIVKGSGVVSIFVQNEIGTVQPIFELNTGSLFSDMSQAPGKIKIPKLSSIKNLDVAVFGAHKFGGPSSVGIVYIKDTNNWIKNGTGSRYFLDRAGTPDVCSILATAAALKHATDTLDIRRVNMEKFRAIIETEMETLGFEIIGKNTERVPNTTFAKVPDSKYSHVLMHKLGERKIYIGLGSACGSVHSGISPLLKILGYTSQDFIRISQEGQYGEREADIFIKELKNFCLLYTSPSPRD
jgi:cysteine desulfurase